MSNSTTWTELFVELRDAAECARGVAEINCGTSYASSWPKTTGADALAIIALVDPHVRAATLRCDARGLVRRWRAAVASIGPRAMPALGATYPENRDLWATLLVVFVYLTSIDAPLPDPSAWRVLVDELGDVLATRNLGPSGDGPFKHFDGVKAFDDLHIAQVLYLKELRGFDRMKPEPGMTGGEKMIPRATNADVLALADYWSRQLGAMWKHMDGERTEVMRRWRTALVDVDQLARPPADPNAVYSKNNAFFRELSHTARRIATADEYPSDWDIGDSFKHAVTHLPENISAGAHRIASGIADAAGDVAHAAGKVANEAAKGAFSGFGTPFLIGAGLVGLFLMSRSPNRAKPEAKE